MSDYLTREFRTQLTATMDAVLRRAVFEIMNIFEHSLHNHRMELEQKGEEIAQLKTKLQTAEIKLSESDRGGDKRVAMNRVQVNEMKREPEDVLNAHGQTSDVPEIHFEVPADWCAPLGSETVTKQDDCVSPRVRLHRLSIPSCHVPALKQEVVNRGIDSDQQKKGCRRSKRGSSVNEGLKHTQGRSLPIRDQGTGRRLRNDMKVLLQDIKQEYADLMGRPKGLRGRGRHLRGREQQNTLKSKVEERKGHEAVERDDAKRYSCKFCKKVFDTEFGRNVHARSHKRCRGCKKEFPFPRSLTCHQRFCAKFKNLLAKDAQSTDPPKPQSGDKEKPTAPSKKHLINQAKTSPSSNHREASIQKDGPTNKHFCANCNTQFISHFKLKEHMRIHTGEKPFTCSMCPKKFRINQALKLHITRMHKDKVSSSETHGGLAWTKPLEETEEDREDLISPCKDKSQTIKRNNVPSQRSPDKNQSARWQTMGKRCSDGFTCLLCQKVVTNKCRLIEHFHTHTAEKPIKCEQCHAGFRSQAQLSMHKKRCRSPTIQCAKCEKKFSTHIRYNKHMSKCHRDWPNNCKVCGKGFITKGHLRNHIERCH